MFLGKYECDGDPAVLLPAYDKFVAGFPPGNLMLHVCVVRDGGITIYDACPSQEVFRAFTSDPGLKPAFAAAGLPEPRIEELGEVHNAAVVPEALT